MPTNNLGPKPMLATPFDSRRLARWPADDLLVQPKLDGWRAIATPTPGGYQLTSRTGKPIVSCPHILQELNQLLPTRLVLDGELYLHGQPREFITSRISRTVNLHPDHQAIEYHVFDTLGPDPQLQRLVQLFELPPMQHIRCVQSRTYNHFDLERALDKALNDGYEGIVLRNLTGHYVNQRSYQMLKLKPTKRDTYRVVGWEEECSIHGQPKGALGALWVRPADSTNPTVDSFKVGTGFTRPQRNHLWDIREELSGRLVEVNYQSISSDNKPWPGVFVSLLATNEEDTYGTTTT